MHSGFNIHRSQRVPPRNGEDMERLAQYIIRNPFSADKMQPNSSGDSIIYRWGMNPESRTLDSHRPISHPHIMEITASSSKLRANAPEGQKAIFY